MTTKHRKLLHLRKESISLVLPAKNEANNLKKLLPKLKSIPDISEILVVNNGSTDNTEKLATEIGARNATGDILVFMDADG